MSEVFWEVFREWYRKYFWIGIGIAIGIALGNYAHPYEQCARMYNSPDDIGECVWIKQND